ncbi:hypothetical protein SLA2020_386300 [Shorea laevis]
MEGFGGLGFSNVSSATRKKRSSTSRRPRNEAQQQSEFHDISSLSSTPPSDNNLINIEDGKQGDSDEASNDGTFQGGNEWKQSGLLAPTNWKSMSNDGSFGVVSDGLENEKKVKKVKLKVGGVTRTIDAKSVTDGSSSGKSTRFSGASHSLQKFVIQDISDDHPSLIREKGNGLRGAPWKDSSQSSLSAGKIDPSSGRASDDSFSTKYDTLRKSKRVPKKRLLEGVLDDDEDDDEIRYLEKVRTTRTTADYGVDYEDDEGDRKLRKISKVLKRDMHALYDMELENYPSSRLGKDGKKSRSARASEDTDYVEEEESVSDVEPENRKKKARKETIDLLGDSKKEMTVTTRQRALQTGKEISSSLNVNQIEFPNGLPPAPPKKQKEQLSEVEQQLKKAEAAQRRRMQVEKAARESEAEAIRKILGQDSSRKKREDKMKRRQEELAQEKAANATVLKSDSVRWVIGPSGTVVTFPDEIGLPSIFDAKPCSYPPPREKCAVPSCTNPYKYRDSKSKLPLCSLQCYKTIHEKTSPVTAC